MLVMLPGAMLQLRCKPGMSDNVKINALFKFAYIGVDKAVRRLDDARNMLLSKKKKKGFCKRRVVKMMPMNHCQITLTKIIPLQIMHTANICQCLYLFVVFN